MNNEQKPLRCPLCGGIIKKLERRKNKKDKRKNTAPMIKCEHNKYKNGIHTGCNFIMNLSPSPLNGYILSKKEVIELIDGAELTINHIKVHYDANEEFNPILTFPELQNY